MQVSHESPLALLEESRSYNDYDYCLVHLLPQYPQYLNFFKESKEMGRKILLDNSMFELREAFNPDKFAEWIQIIKPDEYIVPDVFADAPKTMDNFISWNKKYSNLPGKKIGVVQGRTYQAMVDCYQFMSEHADKIAISFECPHFFDIGLCTNPNFTKWHIFMSGRQKFIRNLYLDGIWDISKPHHLLGCALPQEFKVYSWKSIESIDTSNPVVAGMHDLRYNDHGLDDKISHKLVDLLESEVSEEQLECIKYNIQKFREINRIQGK